MNKAVVFGAGNIGRSFIGHILSTNGMDVVFVDADRRLVDNLNSRKGYSIVIKSNLEEDNIINITGTSALHSSQEEEIVQNLVDCSLCSTSVGMGALSRVIPLICRGVEARESEKRPPLDIIIAENIRNGAAYFKQEFEKQGTCPSDAGFVETSIGKMVPVMRRQELTEDPLVLHAEKYNTLILHDGGFRNGVPGFPEVKAVANISAWVDRKLFIHNLGHAAAAYLGHERHPDRVTIPGVLVDPVVAGEVRRVMEESARALLAEYPEDYSPGELESHIDDLLNRFDNSALGDTVFRVGRDLPRKLGREDRILGAASLCVKHNLECSSIIRVFYAALNFRGKDENGNRYPGDIRVAEDIQCRGLDDFLHKTCGLEPGKDDRLFELLKKGL